MADAASVAAAAIASGSAGNVSKSIIPVRPDGLPIVALRMSDVTMRVTPEGIWEIHSNALHTHARKEDVAAVTAQVAALKEAQAAMVRDVAALAAERDELAAKNEVLVGMVAEADVAMDRLEGDLEEERLKVEAMKWKVATECPPSVAAAPSR